MVKQYLVNIKAFVVVDADSAPSALGIAEEKLNASGLTVRTARTDCELNGPADLWPEDKPFKLPSSKWDWVPCFLFPLLVRVRIWLDKKQHAR